MTQNTKKQILIVDDEPYLRCLLEQTLEELEEEGVELSTATNGKEAIEFIEEKRPHLVFLDVMMPEVNGFDVCYKIKKENEFRDVTIVMLTAKGQEFDKEKGNEMGADLYLTKPFDPSEIVDTAREKLNL